MTGREVRTTCAGDGCSEGLVISGNDAGLDGLDAGSTSCDPGNDCSRGN